VRSQGKKPALKRPHFSGASGGSLASDKINLPEPAVWKIVVLCVFHAPFKPVFVLGEQLFFSRKEIDSQIKIQAL
jgi:hypothetical protein